MRRKFGVGIAASGLIAALLAQPALAQKSGGILQMPDFASPASMSRHEESTIAAGTRLMGIFNNLVVQPKQVSLLHANRLPSPASPTTDPLPGRFRT